MKKDLLTIKAEKEANLTEMLKDLPVLREKLNSRISPKQVNEIGGCIAFLTQVLYEAKEYVSEEEYEVVRKALKEVTQAYTEKKYGKLSSIFDVQVY